MYSWFIVPRPRCISQEASQFATSRRARTVENMSIDEGDDCAICLSSMFEKGVFNGAALKCGHIFHARLGHIYRNDVWILLHSVCRCTAPSRPTCLRFHRNMAPVKTSCCDSGGYQANRNRRKQTPSSVYEGKCRAYLPSMRVV